MKIIETIRGWFERKPKPTLEPVPAPVSWTPGPATVRLDTSTRLQMQEIGPDAFITNDGTKDVVLEAALIRRLLVPAGKTVRVISPVLERVFDNITRSTKIQEWDAMKVAENMVVEYARTIGYDKLTPQECREVTFPIPDRMLGRILQRMGLRVHY